MHRFEPRSKKTKNAFAGRVARITAIAALGMLASVLVAAAPQATPAAPPLLGAPGARELRPADLRSHPAAFAAPVGERLRYAFSYWGIPLGTATLEVRRYLELDSGQRVAHVLAEARTYAAFDWLYRIHDRAEAFIDIDALRTVTSRSWMEHHHNRIYEEIDYDWDTHWVRVLRERRHSGRGRELVFDFGPFAHDPLDLVYTARSYPELASESVELPVYAAKKIRGLLLEYQGRHRIDSKALGSVAAHKLRSEARLDGRPRGDQGHGELWVAAEGRRIPLRLAGWFRDSDTFRIGGLHAELVEYTPHAPGWGEVQGAPRPPPAGAPKSVQGRPIWRAPGPVSDARHAAPYRAGETRFHFPPQPEGGPYPRPDPGSLRILQPSGESATPRAPRGRATPKPARGGSSIG